MNKKISSPRNIIIALSMLFALVVAYLFVTSWLSGSDEPATLTEVEKAVFTSLKPSGLVYGNLQQAQRLLGLLGDAEVDEKVNSVISSAPSVGTVGASEVLLNASNFFVSSVVLGNEGSLDDSLTLVQGNYAGLDIKSELAKQFTMHDIEKNLVLLEDKPVSSEGDFECPTNETQNTEKLAAKNYAYLSDTQIIISASPNAIKTFLAAYTQPTQTLEENQNSLSHWREYRQGSLFSVMVFDQQLLSQDFTTEVASSALLGDASYQHVGLRGNLNVAKQSLDVSFDASLDDKSTASDLAAKIDESIAELNRDNEEIFPAVTDLLSRVSVKADSGLHIGLVLDKDIASEIGSVATDFVGMIFSSGSVSSDDDNGQPPADELDKSGWDYAINEKVLQASALPEDQFQRFLPVATQNNVAFFIKGLGVEPVSRFEEDSVDAMQLEILAKRPAALDDDFYDWSDSGITQSVSISQVLDQDGNNLLEDERCKKTKFNQDLNHQPNDSLQYSKGGIVTTKKVRLIDGVYPPQISKVIAEYSFNVPVNVELKDVTLAQPQQTWPGGSFRLTNNKNGSISYVFKDEQSLLLNVIALNSAGQALRFSSSFGSDTQSTSEFKGDVATVRLALAGNFKKESFPFEINSLTPTLKPEHKADAISKRVANPSIADRVQVTAFSAAQSLGNLSEEQKKAIGTRLGWSGYSLEAPENQDLGNVLLSNSILFFKHDAESTWNHKLSGLILMPHSQVLLSADALVTAKLKIDGKPVDPAVVSISKATRGEELVPAISVDGLELDMATFTIPFDEQTGQIKAIEGTLEFAFPTKTSVRSFKREPNNPKIEGLRFIQYLYNHEGATVYEVDESLVNAVLVKLTTVDNVEYVGKVKTDDGTTTVTFDSLVELSQVDFWFVDESEILREEFKFVPNYQ